jgi:HD superfamily phosphohydrolase
MFATVYWHHACRAALVMLLRAVQEALRSGHMEPRSVERTDDANLLRTLASDDAPDPIGVLASALRDRRLYKRAVEVRVDDERYPTLERLWFHPTQRAVLEDGWAAAAGASPPSVLLDIPEPRPIVVDLPIVIDDGEANEWDRVSGLTEADLERLQRSARLIRVFAATPELAAKVGDPVAALS